MDYSLIFYYLFCLLAFLILSNNLITNKRNIKHFPLPPGPTPWPIVGNLPELTKNNPAYKWVDSIMEQFATDIACIRLGNVHIIVVSSAEIAREFLHVHDDIFATRPPTLTFEYATYGYLTMGLTPMGRQWKKMRKMYSRELVSPVRLRWLLNKRNQEADNLVWLIYDQCKVKGSNGAIVDLRSIARHYCVNVAKKMTFNRRYFGEIGKGGGPGKEDKEHVEALFTLLCYMNAFCISDFLPWLRVLDLDGQERLVKSTMRVLKKYYDPIIDDRTRQWKEGKRGEPEDLLDVLILLKDESGEPLLSLDEIRAQCAELFFPVDTPANAVEWTIAEMLNQPHILHKATNEIDKVVGRHRLVQESDIPKLNYLKACIKEALRLHPVTPFNLPHVAISDANIAGYFIPKDSYIVLYRKGLGQQPQVWKEPLKFKPERHFSDMSSVVEITEPNLRLVTFSTGKRGCPAMSLGTAMTVMLLGRLIQGFDWTPNMKKIDISESDNDLSLAKALHAIAKPRLPMTTYFTVGITEAE